MKHLPCIKQYVLG